MTPSFKGLRHLAPMSNITQFETIIAIDIETSSKGVLLDIGFYDGEHYQCFQGWDEFFTYLVTLYHCDTRIIAHNGFGFDFITFNQWLLDNRKTLGIADDDITYLSSESLLISVIIDYNGAQYTFIDTLRYFPAQSLQKLAESFLNESKDDVPNDYISRMENYKAEYPDKYYAYLHKDCEILHNVYCEFRQEINSFTPIGELGLSAGSTSMRSFRKWLHINYPKTRIFAAPIDQLHVADYAYRGGLTLYIGDGVHTQHKYENVYHYDVISMYPSVMRYVPVPSSPMVITDKLVTDFGTMRPGWYLVDFEQIHGRVPIFFTLESEYPQWKGQSVLSHFDLQFLDHFGRYQILEGIVYEDYLFPFERYFNDLLELRMEAKRKEQHAKSWALKILANSLYGKFGQKASREIISITSNRDWYDTYLEAQLRDYGDSGITEYAVSNDYVLYGVESQSTSFSNRFIGAMVTSLARLKLGIMLNTYHSIYCDTDSIFTQDTLHEVFTGNRVGNFELSLQESATMICLGKKSYLYGDDLKFKGIPAKHLTQADMELMRYDVTIDVNYRTPTAWKTAIRNHTENPNEFKPRKRRVKRGQSLAEIGLLRTDHRLFTVTETNDFLEDLLSL
jgi:hypothetical protein